jgi:lipopolysaccharide biosynthesis protein
MGIGAAQADFEHKDFPAGTMFWFRPPALMPLVKRLRDGGYEGFPGEPVSKDFTLLHVLERIMPIVCEFAGYKVVCGGVRSLTGGAMV